MTLIFVEGHEVTSEWVHSLVKQHEITQPYAVADYAREVTAKKFCIFSTNGSFEHLLFLLLCDFVSVMLWCLCVLCDQHKDKDGEKGDSDKKSKDKVREMKQTGKVGQGHGGEDWSSPWHTYFLSVF